MNSPIPPISLKITPEFLLEFERLASLMFSMEKIAAIMQVDYLELVDFFDYDPQHRGADAFNSGRLKREATIRQSIFDLAENGSSPAQTMAWKMIENAKAESI